MTTGTGTKLVPVLYTDIDGTIRLGKDELGRFVNTEDDVEVFPGVPELLWGYRDIGWRIIGVSNQAGIALGYMDAMTCIKAMIETQRQTRNAFDRIDFCAHAPDAECECRKPKPGLIFAAREWLTGKFMDETYPMNLGVFVGDRPEDEQCAKNAGLRFIPAELWRTGAHMEELVTAK